VITVPSAQSLAIPSQNGHQPRDGSGQTITVSFVLNAIRQWWKVATPIGLVLAAVAGTLIYLTFEPVYEASAWLQIYSVAPRILPDRVHNDSRLFVETQVQLMHSPLVLGPVISQPEIASFPEVQEQQAPIEWLAGEIKVSSVGRSELFQVSFAGPNASNSAEIVNAVTDAYFDLRGQQDAEQTQRIIELLKRQLESQTNEATRLREQYRELTLGATGKDPFPGGTEAQVVTAPHPLHELQGQLIAAQVEQAVLKARVAALEESPTSQRLIVPDAEVNRAIAQHPEVKDLEAKIAANEARLREYKDKLAGGEKDPMYQSLSRKVESDRHRLDGVREQLRPQVKGQMEEALANTVKSELHDMQAQLHDQQVLEKLLQERYEEELKPIIEYSGETFDVELARGAYARAEQVVERVDERIMMLKIGLEDPDQVVLMRSADPPRKPVEMLPYKMLALGPLACFCLPFALAVVWERVVRRVSDRRQLEQDLHLPVIGEVSHLPVRRRVSSASASRRVGNDVRVFEESVDSLRTYLALSEPLKDVKVLAVTSAANNEGKTSVSIQLAVSSARASGELTLLIDGDMRSPDIHNVLETRAGPGLAEVLSGDCTVQDAIITDWGTSVHVLPAGKLRRSPHKLVGNGALKSLLDEVRASYRYIIIDTPPILAAGEALVFAKGADGSLICTMRDVSRVDQVNAARRRLLAANANPIGFVLNGVSTKQYAYRYGSYAYDRV